MRQTDHSMQPAAQSRPAPAPNSPPPAGSAPSSTRRHRLQDEATIEPRCAASARPGSLFPSRDRHPAGRTLIDVSRRPPRNRQERAANLFEAGAREVGNSVGNAVVAVLGMPSQVAVQPVAHVNQLFGDDDFQSPRLRLIDARKVDENQMLVHSRHERVGAADRSDNAAPKPRLENRPVCSDPHTVNRESEQCDVPL